MTAAQKRWKPWRWIRLDLVFKINSLKKFSTSRRSTKFKDILLWNISQVTTMTALISTRIAISCGMKRGTLFWVWRKFSGNWDNNMIRQQHCPLKGNHCKTNDSPNQYENIRKLWDEKGHPLLSFEGNSMETETTTWLHNNISHWRETTTEQILVSDEIISKELGCEVTVRSE